MEAMIILGIIIDNKLVRYIGSSMVSPADGFNFLFRFFYRQGFCWQLTKARVSAKL